MEIKELKINDIEFDKGQPRKSFDAEKLKEMSETFKTQGTIQPIEVDENNVIITGELRYRACKMAGLQTIPCKIIRGLSPEQKLERQLVENFNRQDMRLVDSMVAVKKYMRMLSTSHPNKYSHENMKEAIGLTARNLGISREWLSQNLKLDREAPEELKQAIKEERISVSTATEIMKAPKEEREELTKEVLEMKKIPEHRIVREKIADKKVIKELKEKNEQMKKEDDKKLRIIRATEVVATYRSELNLFMKEASRAVYKIKSWKRMDYSWFDDRNRKDLHTLIKDTQKMLYGILEEIEKMENSIR